MGLLKNKLTPTVMTLWLVACASDNDPTRQAPPSAVAGGAGVAGQAGASQAAGKSGGNAAGSSALSQLPTLSFAGTTGRDPMGACPTPVGTVCTGSFMDYYVCTSMACQADFNDCYGTSGACLSVMGCIGGCACGDAACEMNCVPKDCAACMQRLDSCASKMGCKGVVCGPASSAGAGGAGGASGLAAFGGSGLVAGQAGAGTTQSAFAGAAGAP